MVSDGDQRRAVGVARQLGGPNLFLLAWLGVMYLGALDTLARFFDAVFYLVAVWSLLGAAGAVVLAWVGAALASLVAVWATIPLGRAARNAGWLTTGRLLAFVLGLLAALLVVGQGELWRTALVVVAGCSALVFGMVSARPSAA